MACQRYEDVNGTLPPAVVYGPDGKPLHSWRVLILPFIEEDCLLKQFKLDEPWDSPHNLALLEKMPRLYAPPRSKESLVPPYHTICHVFVGPGTAFEGPQGLKLAKDFPNGTSNTLLFVEAGEPVPWTKPQEIAYDPAQPPPRLRGFFKNRFRACTADGSRRNVEYDTPDEELRSMITRNGREKRGE